MTQKVNKMKKLFLFLILMIVSFNLFAEELTSKEKAWLVEHNTIRIAPDPHFPPIEWLDENGEYKGIASDFMKLISDQLGLEFEVIECKNWHEVLQKARNREVDMLPAAAQTPPREKYMDFSDPYLIFPGVIINRTNQPKYKNPQDLFGKKVVIVKGYVWEDMFTLHYPEIEIITVTNLKEGLRRVSMGTDDILIATLPIALYYIKQEGIHNLQVTGETGFYTKLSVLTRNDWPVLGQIMNKTIKNIPVETKDKINKKWILIEDKPILQHEEFWYYFLGIIIVSFVVIAFIYQWNRSLKRLVEKRTEELQKDVEKRKRTEKALEESEKRFRKSVMNAPFPVIIHAEDGSVVLINNEWERMTGYSKDEIPTMEAWFEKAHPSNKEVIKKRIDSLYENIGLKSEVESEVITKNGEKRIWFFQTSSLGKNSQGLNILISMAMDITKMKLTEMKLRENEENLRQLTENIDQVFWLVDWETKGLLYVSPSYEKIYGRSIASAYEEMMSWEKSVHPDDYERVAEVYAESARDEKYVEAEYRIKTPSGEVKWVYDRSYPIKNDNGKVYRFACIAEEITKRKLAEKKLRQSEERLQKAQEIAKIGNFEWNLQSDETFWSKQLYKLHGRNPQSGPPTYKEFLQQVHPADREKVKNNLKKAIKNGDFSNIYRAKKYDNNELRYFSGIGRLSFDKNNKPRLLQVTEQDITERRQAEKELRIKDKAIKSSNSAIVLSQIDGKLTYANSAFLEMWGYDSEKEVLDKYSYSFWQIEDEAKQVAQKSLESGSWQGEMVAKRKDGSTFNVLTSANLVLDQNGNKLCKMASFTDITERKEAEKELEKYRDHLEELVKERTRKLEKTQKELIEKQRLATLGEFAGSLSHEIKNPLAVIDSSVINLQYHEKDDKKFTKHLQRIRRAVKKSENVINSLRRLTKKAKPKLEEIEINSLIETIVGSTQISSNIDLLLELSKEELKIDADKIQIKICIDNLIRNAVDAVEGKGTIRIKTSKKRKGMCEIIVEDNGEGIEPENMDRIFEPLYSSKSFGIGFGLPLVKQIVKSHHGEINVESILQKGTKFIILLPLSD